MIRVSKVAAGVVPSATLAAGAKARQLRSQGVKVYDYSLGEPDFDTPAHICEAARDAMAKGRTHYTPANGVVELRQAVGRWYKAFHGLDVAADQVLVSNGAKHSIHNALLSMCDPGDEVVIPAPYWVSYSDLVTMTGAKDVLIPTTLEAKFKASPRADARGPDAQDARGHAQLAVQPTGSVYTRDELAELLDVILRHSDAAVLSDEIYEQLTYGDATPTCLAALRPDARDRIVTISGASKSYAMTGWRMGWAVGRST
jgi:aspartate aminotransferase